MKYTVVKEEDVELVVEGIDVDCTQCGKNIPYSEQACWLELEEDGELTAQTGMFCSAECATVWRLSQ